MGQTVDKNIFFVQIKENKKKREEVAFLGPQGLCGIRENKRLLTL